MEETMNEMIFYHGDILTMEEDVCYVPAVYIKDGWIIKTGTIEELKLIAGVNTKYIDLEGRTLMPAFLDPHGHFTGYANSLLQVPLEEAVSCEEIGKKISEYITKNQIAPGIWVFGKGYDQNQLPGNQHPTKELLDAAAPDNPVVIQHASGHMGVFNSLGLKELHISSETECPDGGRIEIKEDELTGYLEENAFVEYLKRVPMPSVGDLFNVFQTAQQHYAAYGITTAQEGMMPDLMADIYHMLLEKNVLKLDIVGYVDSASSGQLFNLFPDGKPEADGLRHSKYDRHFRLGGYKTFLDGSPQGRTAWMREPYKNAENGYRGYPALSRKQLTEQVYRAYQEGRQILAHCNGDAAAELYLSVLKEVQDEEKRRNQHCKNIRPVMIHAQLLGRDQLPKVKECGVIPSFFVAHVYHWGDVHLKNFGEKRASYISPAASAEREKICYTFHQDAPVIAPNMLETIWCAVNRRTKQGILLGKEERVSIWSALKAVTIYAAAQYSEEKEKGSIRSGKRADLILLNQNPLKTDPEALREIQVLETYKDGECIYHK